MNGHSVQKSKRNAISPNNTFTLTLYNTTETKTFNIIDEIGDGGTVIAYKVSFDGADTVKYLYVLKEVYPLPSEEYGTLLRGRNEGKSLDIENFNHSYYKSCCERFEDAYRLQSLMANGEDKVLSISTSLPIGLYEDIFSSEDETYALYGLYRYDAGNTLNKHHEESLLEIVDIQRKIAEVVNAYHRKNYLWLDIKETNVNIVGQGSVQNVSMFDFGSLVSMDALSNYSYDEDNPSFMISFSRSSDELLLPFELESLIEEANYDKTNGQFLLVNPMNVAQSLNALGEYGRGTDIFLLGSLFFKRLYGKAPTIKDCIMIQKGTFDVTQSERLSNCSKKVLDSVLNILKNTLNYEDIERRYTDASELLVDYNKLHMLISTDMVAHDIEKHITRSVRWYSDNYNFKKLTSANGKFSRLKALSGRRFNSYVAERKDDNTFKDVITPVDAIESDRLIFLYGDGGIGKSTSMYDYLQIGTSINIYIDLSTYVYDREKFKKGFIIGTIIENICNNFADSTGYDKDSYDFPRALIDSFSSCSSSIPEYTLILDGYNEISNEQKGYFDTEVEQLFNSWENVRFIITGRSVPTNISGEEEKAYIPFRKFRFTGVTDEELLSVLKTEIPDRADKVLHDTRLLEVLHIPLFLGMYLNLQIDTVASIHTRGEILDQYIICTEKNVAEHIAEGQNDNKNSANRRMFLVCLSLPFVGNYMDKEKTFHVSDNELFEMITEGNLLYLVKKIGNNAVSVYNSYLGKKYSKESVGFDERVFKLSKLELLESDSSLSLQLIQKRAMQEVLTLNAAMFTLLNEAGYCYLTDDNNIAFAHQYFRDYFAAKHIQNILEADQSMDSAGLSRDEQLQFTKDYGLDYPWSDEVCILLGEIIGDYKNEPGYTEE